MSSNLSIPETLRVEWGQETFEQITNEILACIEGETGVPHIYRAEIARHVWSPEPIIPVEGD